MTAWLKSYWRIAAASSLLLLVTIASCGENAVTDQDTEDSPVHPSAPLAIEAEARQAIERFRNFASRLEIARFAASSRESESTVELDPGGTLDFSGQRFELIGLEQEAASAYMKAYVWYGPDDSMPVGEIADAGMRANADRAVALFVRSALSKEPDGRWWFSPGRFGETWNLCPDHPYRDEPVGSYCSGFLVGTDTIATAAHCLDSVGPTDLVAVFNFDQPDISDGRTWFDAGDVYPVVESVGKGTGSSDDDWAVLRLERSAHPRTPVALESETKLAPNDAVYTIGHPAGLPKKLAGGAVVWDIEAGSFTANLDTYKGSSGSMVVNAATHRVEGILRAGEDDFEVRSPEYCVVTRTCSPAFCAGETVTRAARLSLAQHDDTRAQLLGIAAAGSAQTATALTD